MQHYAVVVLDYLERVEKSKAESRALKLALIAAGVAVSDVFPEFFTENDDDAELPDEETAVTYVFPGAPEDTQSIEQELLGLVADAAHGTASFADRDW